MPYALINIFSAKSAMGIPHEQHEQIVLFGGKNHFASGYAHLPRRRIDLRRAHAQRLAERAAFEKLIGARQQLPNRKRLDDAGACPDFHAVQALFLLRGVKHHDRRDIERANVLE